MKFKKFFFRLPGKLRLIAGVLLGGLIGLIGGLAGLIIGMVLGYLVQELLGQFAVNSEVRLYYDNPGAFSFYEGEPGLAAFCGLGILIIAKSALGQINTEVAIAETVRKAKLCFPGAAADHGMIENFCRLAWSRRGSLNPDLLAESLVCGRRHSDGGDNLHHMGAVLYNLASTDTARRFAQDIWHTLDPQFEPAPVPDDPWKILDISPQTPLSEVKAHYRMLAAQFHPDVLQGLDEEHRQTAAHAFIAIQKAYDQILQIMGRL
ncbi:MAG: J domain-containing protein [Treponema sp.]|nr:J domain-containing protein [Treponema sp.]